ncbi:hypothetical protein MHU86_12261 [Fragilaria crotonensis]|nr:hypothetical protein MHU86_12261 [Fragilaria crotonensis]
MQASTKHTKGIKPTLFHEKWLMAYALHVTARDAATGSFCRGLGSIQTILKQFFGGLANVFPGTVESDFSLINWEKDDYRTILTDLSLEGILHCKQYFELLGVANEMK